MKAMLQAVPSIDRCYSKQSSCDLNHDLKPDYATAAKPPKVLLLSVPVSVPILSSIQPPGSSAYHVTWDPIHAWVFCAPLDTSSLVSAPHPWLSPLLSSYLSTLGGSLCPIKTLTMP